MEIRSRLIGWAGLFFFLGLALPLTADEGHGVGGREVSLFAEGCPRPGLAQARAIVNPGLGMQGPDALGGPGDFLLMNEKAAFIIQGVEQINSYYYYGGIPIDAVALDGCVQANAERFEELGFFVGAVDRSALLATGVRAFRGERVEIVNDGQDGGAAVVRVYGRDDVFWIVELELIRLVYDELNVGKPHTHPLGLELFVDYILPPGSSALRIEYNLRNREPTEKHLFTGSGAFFGDSTVNRYFSDGTAQILGFDLDTKLPFLASSGGQGAWAFGMKDAVMATANLSGFDVMFDIRQLQHRIRLAPAGRPGDTATLVYYLAVGDSDFNSALAGLNEVNPHPLRGWDLELKPFTGRAFAEDTGAPLMGVQIEIAMKNREGQWKFLDGFQSDADGAFGGLVPDLGREYRLTAHLEGRPDPAPVYFRVSSLSRVEVGLSPGGTLGYEVRDDEGRGLPARIGLYQRRRLVRTLYSRTGSGEAMVAPGTYEVSVTRGYEYVPYEGRIEMAAGRSTALQAVLVHAVNTDGFLSADMHLHAGPSGDNKISITERIITVAAEGLEVAVGTDHEAIISWAGGVEESGLGPWVATVVGEEVTATIPEHINMFPVEPRFEIDARGGPVRWYGLDIGEIYSAIRERGGRIIQLNHPLGYMDAIAYDCATGQARLTHPEYLGLAPGASLWSWNFDTFEYQNGNDQVFKNPLRPASSGTFEYWMSFINLGHRITAVSNTDAHDYHPPGAPRTYFKSSTDKPAEFEVESLIQSLQEGRAVTSTGAFARVKINNQAEMGDTAISMGHTVDLWVHIESIPQIDVSHFKVFVNCDQTKNIAIPLTGEVIKYDGHVPVRINQDSQIVVMGFGKNHLPRGLPQFDPVGVPRFTTNPIYVDYGGDGYEPPGWDGCRYTLP